MLWLLCSPPCILHSTQCFFVQTAFFGFLGMQELINSIFCFSLAPLALIALGGGCMISLSIILEVLKDKQKATSTDSSGILRPLGRTHSQQVSWTLGIIQGRYFLCSLVCLHVTVQVQKSLKVAVNCFVWTKTDELKPGWDFSMYSLYIA